MQQQNAYVPAVSNGGRSGQTMPQNMDWSGEITMPRTRPALDTGMGGMQNGMGVWDETGNAPGMQNGMNGSNAMQRPMQRNLDMQNNLSDEVITAPVSTAEVYAGSLKAMLRRNLGNYVVATFLVGTQGTVSWEGVLYDVGNDYVTIYQPGRDRYVVIDMYSLKYMEFYDVQRRRLCDRLLMEQGWDRGENWTPSR